MSTTILTAKLSTVLVRVFGSFLIGGTRNIKQAINARLNGICMLVSEFERLLRISGVFVDHFTDQILNRRDVFGGAELK